MSFSPPLNNPRPQESQARIEKSISAAFVDCLKCPSHCNRSFLLARRMAFGNQPLLISKHPDICNQKVATDVATIQGLRSLGDGERHDGQVAPNRHMHIRNFVAMNYITG